MTSNQRLEDLARTVAPILHLDNAEPFAPISVGLQIDDVPDGVQIEYTVAWEADIGHLRESEHLWVHVDHGGRVRGSASAHGSRVALRTGGSEVGALVVEPGKHAMNVHPEDFTLPRDLVEWMCGEAAGIHGLLPWGAAGVEVAHDRGAVRYLRSKAFTPTWQFDRVVDLAGIPWQRREALDRWIDERARIVAAAQDTSPVGWTADGWDGDGDVVVVREVRWNGASWTSATGALARQMERARKERRRLLLVLDGLDGSVETLWDLAWSHYVSSMIVVVADGPMALAAARTGFTTARRVAPLEEPRAEGWVAAATPEAVERWAATSLVIGPGSADIICDL